MSQTIEQFLFEQLNKIAPGKYTLGNVLQLFKSRLRFPCSHLKGGRSGKLPGYGKDYNLSIFTFPTGVTEVKCLYNCGLKVRSDDKELVSAFNELVDLPSTNTKATSEIINPNVDPGPVPTYSDEYRQRVRESGEMFLTVIDKMLEHGRIKLGDPILGGVFPHPDPVEAPDSIIERSILKGRAVLKNRRPVLKATVVVQDSIPEVKSNTKIRKSRKANQSRSRGK